MLYRKVKLYAGGLRVNEYNLFGRRVIYTDVDEITESNVLEVLATAMCTHKTNRSDIQYLYDYYRGKQPILGREKDIRPEICNKIVENRANEIVSFKVGYLMGEPVQYVSRTTEESGVTDAINMLNDFVFAEDKAAKDKELADWFTICGTAFRMVLPDLLGEEDESPFEIYTLDPRSAFVVYHSGLGNKPKMGVKYITRADGTTIYSVYTETHYFEITQPSVLSPGVDSQGTVTKSERHMLGCIPIIEYPANSARLGAFEIVLPLLDALNRVQSNRLDGVEQFIQALLVLENVDMESEKFKELRENGGIRIPKDSKVYYLTQELNQTQTQTLVDYMYQTILVICGMPNRNGGSSTSDTGSAVIMRDGWSDAEARAKDTEMMFKMSEKQFLRIAIRIANIKRDMNLRLSSIDIRFTRRNYDNIQSKSQVLTTLLANDKVHPRLAFEHCGLFVDPDLAYAQSVEYYEAQHAEQMHDLAESAKRITEEQKRELDSAIGDRQ